MYKGSDFSTFLPALIFNYYYYYYYCHLNGYKLVSHCGFLRCGVHLEACGILVPRPRIKLGPLQWKCQVLTTGGCCLIAQSCPTLCNPMDCSTPVFPVLHHHLEFAHTHVHWVHWWCHPTISFSVIPFSSCLQSFPPSGSFPMSLLVASGGQSIGASASASVLPMNIQDWITTGPNHWTTREFPSWFWFTFR